MKVNLGDPSLRSYVKNTTKNTPDAKFVDKFLDYFRSGTNDYRNQIDVNRLPASIQGPVMNFVNTNQHVDTIS